MTKGGFQDRLRTAKALGIYKPAKVRSHSKGRGYRVGGFQHKPLTKAERMLAKARADAAISGVKGKPRDKRRAKAARTARRVNRRNG